MNDTEYEIMIKKIVASGKGFKAIRDLSSLMEFEHKKTLYDRDDLASSIRLVGIITKSNQSAKSKINTITNLLEPDENQKEKERKTALFIIRSIEQP